ncbi:hypothetical protein D3C79_1034650 [compost metagenome]
MEQAGEVAVRRLAIEQVGVGSCADIGKVGGAHAHACPAHAFGDRSAPAIVSHVIDEVTERALVVVERVGLLLQGRQQLFRGLVRPVAK